MRWSLRLPGAVVTALAVAEAAVLLLRPRGVAPHQVPVSARAYFSDEELARAAAFRSRQRLIGLAATAMDAAVVGRLTLHPPARGVRALAGRPVAGGAAAGAGLSVGLTAAGLPLSALARRRARDVGLVTQGWQGWAADVAKAQAIGTVLAAGGGALLVAGMRRLGGRWWLPGGGAVTGLGVLTLYAGPVLLDPLFNSFSPAEPALRDEITALAREAGVEVGTVLVMDASRRTTASNAYVTGLGATKRVVLYDNLLRDFDPAEVRFVVAHELAHVRHRDVLRALAHLAVAAPAGLRAVARLAERLGAQPDARAVPATVLAAGLLLPAMAAVSHGLSRAVERRADAFALRITGDPDTLIAFHRRIAVRNVAEVDPPAWVRLLHGTHPTTLERIGAAEAARPGRTGALCAS